MKRLFDEFQRVSKKTPCPMCGRADWCMVSREDPPSRCVCKRIESSRKCGQAGWIHELRFTIRERGAASIPIVLDREPPPNFAAYGLRDGNPRWKQAVPRLVERLKVTDESLLRLGADGMTVAELAKFQTWARANCCSFPMFDAQERVIGIRLRAPDGGKFAVKGSRNGLFIPKGRPDPFELLLVAEGESDAAALLDLGFFAIGKPGADGADDFVVQYVKRNSPAQVVVVADNDEVGRTRAARLGARLAAQHRDVRVIHPPEGTKDARAWKIVGADHSAVCAAIDAAERIRLRIGGQ